MPTARDILAASLCDVMIGNGVWDRTSEQYQHYWLHRADDVMRKMARRGWMMVEIEDGEVADAKDS